MIEKNLKLKSQNAKMNKFEDRSTKKRKKRENKKYPYKKNRKKIIGVEKK